MKNFKLILVLFAALGMTVASCSDDTATPVDTTPNIDFKGGSNYISADATVVTGETFVIGITASSNVNSGKNLTSVMYTVTSNNVVIMEQDSVFSATSYNYDYSFSLANVGDAVFKFVVTDKNGETNTISLTVTAEAGTTPLGAAEATLWKREGANAGTGLSGFGLKWDSNLKAVHAVIKKDVASKFVQLNADSWTTFTTQEELVAAVDAAQGIEDFREISAEASATFNYVLGVIYNNQYFMIHLTSSTVEVLQAGTTITINGESKK